MKVQGSATPKPITKSSQTAAEYRDGRHRFEHWQVDNQVYFITARCRDRFPAFRSDGAKAVFWDRFDHYTERYGFVPWVTSLLDNHYHTLGYLRLGADLPPFAQRLHGSVAKLTNDLLPERRDAFWRDGYRGREYCDGCIRDERQCRRAYRYTLTQCVRHRVGTDPAAYPHTRVRVDLDRGVGRALELNAFLLGVPYKRYDDRRRGFGRRGPAR